MAGRPRKYVDEFYAVEASQKAERVSVGIVGKGRPSRDKVLALIALRGVSVDADASTDRLTFALDASTEAELNAVKILRAPTAPATKVRVGPVTAKGRKIAATRAENLKRKARAQIAEDMGIIMRPGVKLSTPKRSRRKATA
jgi:hypothetical protein